MIQTALGTTSTLSPVPKTKTRQTHTSNEQLQTSLNEMLEAHALQLPQVRASAERGRVRLTGRVRSYYLKQLAQERVLATQGVKSLENQLVVE